MLNKLLAEGIGTAFLLIGVVGSGIMGESLAAGNTAIALLANAIATGCILYVLISVFAPVSGAHFNPAVTLAFGLRGDHPWRDVPGYVLVQILGGIVGVLVAHLMFNLPVFGLSTTVRTGFPQVFSEIVATFGLILVIFGGISTKSTQIPAIVACYITGAYWFTSSTSFANPAVTIARSLTDTFAGIRPIDAPLFIAAQLLAVGLAAVVLPFLFSKK
jgi:glycerol uptake facilitator-like aquaporin